MQVLDGSGRGLSTASMAADRAQANLGVGKGPKMIPSLWDTAARKPGRALLRMASWQNGVRDQASHLRKQQTARSYSLHWWLSHQRPVRVGFHRQARCSHHPWRQCSLYSLNLQLNNGGGSSYPCPPLDCLKRWQSDHTCCHPHRFNELATTSEKWNRKPRLECINGQHPPSKTPVGVLPRTCLSQGKWLSRQTGRQSDHHKWPSQKMWSVEELETQSQGHLTIDHLEERGVMKY